MWLNVAQTIEFAINEYQQSLLSNSPRHIIVDNLFDTRKLNAAFRLMEETAKRQYWPHRHSI
jgi:hypothetical protein